MRPSRLIFLLLLASSACERAAADPVVTVHELLEEFQEAPGVAVAVVGDGEVLLTRTAGLADVAERLPLTNSSAFDLASCSKQFVATAIMQLAERGQLAYDDPIDTYLGELPAAAHAVSIRHLLNHTSGVPDYMELFVEEGKIRNIEARSGATAPDSYEPTAADVVALIARHFTLRFTPGSRFEYSNTGYVLLGQIVERVTQMRLAEYLESHVFGPAGMTRTVLRDERMQPVLDRALSYRDKGARTDIDYTPLNFVYGDGNVNTDVDDMGRYAIALQEGRLLEPESIELAWSAPTLARGESNYGFGWSLGEIEGERLVSHGGSWVGFRSAIVHMPERQLTVVVMSNAASTDAGDLAEEILRAYLER
jgi:CubicO group peptidase (beta-lactamase class C family)